MKGRFYLIFLILCAVLREGILASSEENIEKSQDDHIRKKRLIDHSARPIRITSIRQVPYIVNIWDKIYKIPICAGSILTAVDIITAAHCFHKNSTYYVLTNSIFLTSGIYHKITHIKVHEQFHYETQKNDIALFKISPAIDFIHSDNKPIPLHLPGMPIISVPIVSGWGCSTYENKRPETLRSVALPIVNERLCKNLYPSEAARIDETVICTSDPQRKKTTCPGDSGDPLVVNNHLLGIMIWSTEETNTHYPDIYVKVFHPEYLHWIHTNLQHHQN